MAVLLDVQSVILPIKFQHPQGDIKVMVYSEMHNSVVEVLQVPS
jgi:hypothetical protein